MKTLLVRPGIEIVEKTLRGPWPPELNHLEKIYKQPASLYRGFIQYETLAHSSTLAVGTVLRKLGEDVEFLDVPFEFGIPLTEKLNVKRHEKIEEYIAKGRYDVVAISCTGSFEGVATKRIAEAARRATEDVKVIVGGYEAASEALDFMEKIPAIDIIVLSDFETIAKQLYTSLDGSIPIKAVPNVVYRENGTIHTSEREYIKVKPEDLPIYDYSLIEKYLPDYSLYAIEASRGCPYDCSFCQEKVLRQFYTVKDAPVAVAEIIDAANYIGQFAESIVFYYCDPLWGLKPTWVKRFCSELAERRDEIMSDAFGWGIAVRVGQFDDEELSLMRKAGCTTIGYGVESLSRKMLTMMNKTRDPQKYVNSISETVEKTIRNGIHAALIFIFGMPGETSSTVEETLSNIRKLPLENENLHLKLGLPVVLRGTELDRQIHDPQFIEEYGIKVLAENGWEKTYIPRYTMLFDPSKELSASELTEKLLDFSYGTYGLAASFGKQVEVFRGIKTLLDTDEISPKKLTEMSNIYRKVLTGMSLKC